MKHPALRVAAWQWIAQEYRDRITETILHRAIPLLPFQPARVEIVGSMARGCARLGSDFDINLAAHDWNEQVEWRRLWSDPHRHAGFLAALEPVTVGLRLHIDVAPQNPDQHTYDTCVDLRDPACASAGNVNQDQTARFWNRWTLRWQPKEFVAKPHEELGEDWPESEVRIWREAYGERFLGPLG